jgi:ComF family protein
MLGIIGDIADLILGRRCIGCEGPPTLLCQSCKQAMRGKADKSREFRFDDVSENLRIPLAVAHPYAPPVSSVIFRFKDNQIPALAPHLAELLAGALDLILAGSEFSAHQITAIPIPSRKGSIKIRGFDPMALIAHQLLLLGYSHVPALVDHRVAGRSKSLNSQQRALAASNAFGLRDDTMVDRIAQRPVIVIDDVTTTGATLKEGAELLMHAGVHVIGCASIAGSRRK